VKRWLLLLILVGPVLILIGGTLVELLRGRAP
jgi:hypothetical protein